MEVHEILRSPRYKKLRAMYHYSETDDPQSQQRKRFKSEITVAECCTLLKTLMTDRVLWRKYQKPNYPLHPIRLRYIISGNVFKTIITFHEKHKASFLKLFQTKYVKMFKFPKSGNVVKLVVLEEINDMPPTTNRYPSLAGLEIIRPSARSEDVIPSTINGQILSTVGAEPTEDVLRRSHQITVAEVHPIPSEIAADVPRSPPRTLSEFVNSSADRREEIPMPRMEITEEIPQIRPMTRDDIITVLEEEPPVRFRRADDPNRIEVIEEEVSEVIETVSGTARPQSAIPDQNAGEIAETIDQVRQFLRECGLGVEGHENITSIDELHRVLNSELSPSSRQVQVQPQPPPRRSPTPPVHMVVVADVHHLPRHLRESEELEHVTDKRPNGTSLQVQVEVHAPPRGINYDEIVMESDQVGVQVPHAVQTLDPFDAYLEHVRANPLGEEVGIRDVPMEERRLAPVDMIMRMDEGQVTEDFPRQIAEPLPQIERQIPLEPVIIQEQPELTSRPEETRALPAIRVSSPTLSMMQPQQPETLILLQPDRRGELIATRSSPPVTAMPRIGDLDEEDGPQVRKTPKRIRKKKIFYSRDVIKKKLNKRIKPLDNVSKEDRLDELIEMAPLHDLLFEDDEDFNDVNTELNPMIKYQEQFEELPLDYDDFFSELVCDLFDSNLDITREDSNELGIDELRASIGTTDAYSLRMLRLSRRVSPRPENASKRSLLDPGRQSSLRILPQEQPFQINDISVNLSTLADISVRAQTSLLPPPLIAAPDAPVAEARVASEISASIRESVLKLPPVLTARPDIPVGEARFAEEIVSAGVRESIVQLPPLLAAAPEIRASAVTTETRITEEIAFASAQEGIAVIPASLTRPTNTTARDEGRQEEVVVGLRTQSRRRKEVVTVPEIRTEQRPLDQIQNGFMQITDDPIMTNLPGAAVIQEVEEEIPQPVKRKRASINSVLEKLVPLWAETPGLVTFLDLCPTEVTDRLTVASTFSTLLSLQAMKIIILEQEPRDSSPESLIIRQGVA